jgi:hypothetical protein
MHLITFSLLWGPLNSISTHLVTFLEVFPGGNGILALMVSPRVRILFPLGSIPVKTSNQARRGNTPVKLALGEETYSPQGNTSRKVIVLDVLMYIHPSTSVC